MIVSKYVLFHKSLAAMTAKQTLKAYLLAVYSDARKLALCVLFFVEDSCYVLILMPIVLQIGSLVVFVL